ncbi:hypothetical protein GCQ56_01050 [Marinifilum sp. N1E240]|nr:hypothetical protein [uncultured Marinifilum sp.]MPQ45580.1 hypothetical protein [Marinifilum sp. N1E240]
MIESESEWFEFSCYLTAFLSASRSITFALQGYKKIEGFKEWYKAKQEIIKIDPIAKYFVEIRNESIHTGVVPIGGARYFDGKVEYRFDNNSLKLKDIVSTCRVQFIKLLEIVHDCYVTLGAEIDPQQYYTKEYFATLDLNIDDAEFEVWGWVMTSYIEEGMDEDDRWHELRGRVGECEINHLFKGYLNKVTPQPIIPDRIADFDFTDEERGWDYIPPGFESIEEYRKQFQKSNVGL